MPYVRDLGVDGVWISPCYRSPQVDAGYDVADYQDIDPIFGTLADADELIRVAHELGLRVIVDVVPNHTSDEHRWFVQALQSPPGSQARDRYIFRDGTGPGGDRPPNNWPSVFGGEAWTRVTEADGTPGQWYLHLFHAKQPDLNWQNPHVRNDFHDILRFWLDRGVDGFRVDVAHGLVKADGLPDYASGLELLASTDEDADRAPMWDQDEVHEIYRGWRQVLDGYDGDRMLVAEAWVDPPRLARYVRQDELHQAFNFGFLTARWDADTLRTVIRASLEANRAVGAPATWVLSSHDAVRHATRLALPPVPGGPVNPDGLTAEDPRPDQATGLARARAATTLMLALPGSAYLYQGEELGLPDHTSIPPEYRQDPAFHRSNGEQTGRDGCRVPMP
ncbi:MAG: alpha-amylase, partial [Micrococcales bacterium]